MGSKSVVVAGAGGNIGSHLMESVARMAEVGRVVLIDRDVYNAPRNLLNQDIVPSDMGKPKVLVQARRLAEIRPSLGIEAIHAPLEDVPLGAWRADLILACLDSRVARQRVNECAWRLGVPFADSGVLGFEWLARVNVYVPASEAPCLECAWSEEDYRQLEQLYPCGGPANEPAPNGAPSELGALAASMLALECRKMLTGETDCAAIGRQVTFNARWHSCSVTSFRRNPRCRFDHATWRVEPLHCRRAECESRICSPWPRSCVFRDSASSGGWSAPRAGARSGCSISKARSRRIAAGAPCAGNRWSRRASTLSRASTAVCRRLS